MFHLDPAFSQIPQETADTLRHTVKQVKYPTVSVLGMGQAQLLYELTPLRVYLTHSPGLGCGSRVQTCHLGLRSHLECSKGDRVDGNI